MSKCLCPCNVKPQQHHTCAKQSVRPDVKMPEEVMKGISVPLCKPCRMSIQRIIVTGYPYEGWDRDLVFGILDAEYEVIDLNIMPCVVSTSSGLVDALASEWAKERGFCTEVHTVRAGHTGEKIAKEIVSYGAALCVCFGGLTKLAERAKISGIEVHTHHVDLPEGVK